VALAMLCALLVLVIAGILVYWQRYLLSPPPGAFGRGPYLVSVTSTTAALRWRLAEPSQGPVELRAVADDGPAVLARGGRLRGLRPGTRYAWTASLAGTARASGSFQTAPRGAGAAVRFAVIGDYGSGNAHEWAVGRVLAAAQPQFVLTAGDNSYLVSADRLLDRNLFEPLAAVLDEAPLYPTFGEHDLFWRHGEAITDAFGLPGDEGRYVVRYGPVLVVLLGLEAGPAQLAFARRALAASSAPVRFVVVHRPVGPNNPIIPVLRRAHVAAIFAGHLHRYERRVVSGMLEFTVGTSGEGPGNLQFTRPSPGALVSRLDYGLLRVDAAGRHVSYAFLDERGRVLDRLRR
jgi:hypothetical protein